MFFPGPPFDGRRVNAALFCSCHLNSSLTGLNCARSFRTGVIAITFLSLNASAKRGQALLKVSLTFSGEGADTFTSYTGTGIEFGGGTRFSLARNPS